MSIRDAFARSAVSKIEVDNRTRQNKNPWACNDHTFKLGDDSRCFLSLCRKELIVRTKKTKTNDLGNISLSEHSLWKTDRLRVYEIHIV